MGNAVGGQTQALFLRDLAISKKIPFNKYFLKQIITCFFIAWCCSFLFFLLALFVWTTAYISFVLSLSMFVAILFCVLFALIIPYFLNKFKLDPALGSGPFTTIIQDILSIVIYFSLASWLL
jgi:magnesium transporter